MAIATHMVRITGEFNPKIWNKNNLRKYVVDKIKEIEDVLHPDIELFNIHDNNKVDIWLYIHALPSEVTQKIVDKWAKDHIIEEGLIVKNIEIEVVNSLLDQKPFFVTLK